MYHSNFFDTVSGQRLVDETLPQIAKELENLSLVACDIVSHYKRKVMTKTLVFDFYNEDEINERVNAELEKLEDVVDVKVTTSGNSLIYTILFRY